MDILANGEQIVDRRGEKLGKFKKEKKNRLKKNYIKWENVCVSEWVRERERESCFLIQVIQWVSFFCYPKKCFLSNENVERKREKETEVFYFFFFRAARASDIFY